ncbi:unnamed protein product [Enterobius vermicularis]|uniref:Coat protein n=1 Tax=Enterobius vermicularis TaxID=51028 RepID=A0A0N4VRP0_ENTVE|nr:unnamed protein product [Enterobius vermicularis]
MRRRRRRGRRGRRGRRRRRSRRKRRQKRRRRSINTVIISPPKSSALSFGNRHSQQQQRLITRKPYGIVV